MKYTELIKNNIVDIVITLTMFFTILYFMPSASGIVDMLEENKLNEYNSSVIDIDIFDR